LLRRGRRTLLTRATSDCSSELAALQERNRDLHKPWVYHTDIDLYFQRIAIGRTIGLFLWEATEKSLIGVININEPVLGGFKSAYLGYYIDAMVAGQGYMTEGLTLAIDYAFADLAFHRLEANIQPDNSASISLVKRLGFRLEGFSPRYLCINGVWRDHKRWAILAEEWEALRKTQPS
jgi:[ribosomal protein S5]-alanine N-acetyltransferase